MMRPTLCILALVFLVTAVSLCADKPPDVNGLRAMADAATGGECTHICLEAARVVTEQANQFFTEGNVEKAQATMKEAVHYAEKAAQACVQSRKKEKQTEIGLRKLEKRILDIKETLNFEDKPPLQEAADAIEKSRATILAAMFDLDSPKNKK